MRKFSIFVGAFALSAALAHSGQAAMNAAVERWELNSGWSFCEASNQTWLPATVPGCVHTDLLTNKLIPDPFFGTNEQQIQWVGEKDWVYQTTFDVPAALFQRDSVELDFKGLDTYAHVELNGSLLLEADDMFREWRIDCRGQLKEKGNVLSIRFRNVFDENLPKSNSAPFPLQDFANNDQAVVKIAMYSRKAQFHYGWDWGPRLITCGVWRPVVLEGWNAVNIRGVRIDQEQVSNAGAEITSVFEIRSASKQRVHLRLTADGEQIAEGKAVLMKGMNTVAVKGKIENPKLWWPNGMGEHYLYEIDASVESQEGLRDNYTARIGIRSLEVVRKKDSLGMSLFLRVNGIPVFMKGADYIPQDNFQNRVTGERHEFIIKSAAQANMNMLRVWGGGIFEDDVFYEKCDQYGILLWHDMMFACAMYPSDDRFLDNVRNEIKDNIRRLRNHPSVALYCGNNENDISWFGWGWKQLYPQETQDLYQRNMRHLFDEVIPEAIREIDPGRYYHFSSPSVGFDGRSAMDGDIHYWGVWHGKEPFESYEKNIGRFVSEYGFQSYPQLSSVEKFTDRGDRELHSTVMLSHQRCLADERRDKEYGNRLIATYMEQYMPQPRDFPSYLYASQVLQAEGVKMAIEAHRRNMPVCMGTLFWQIDDCWPVASWSSIDYYGEWKALHYYAKRLYEPVLIAPRLDGEKVNIFIVSDRQDAIPAELQVRILDFGGEVLFSRSIPVTIKPGVSSVYASFTKSELVKGKDERQLVIASTIHSAGATVAENLTYFKYPRELQLQQPDIKIAARRVKVGYEVEVESNTLAKSVLLTCDGIQGLFADNYFDLLPHTKKKIEFKTATDIDGFLARVKIMSLVDSSRK